MKKRLLTLLTALLLAPLALLHAADAPAKPNIIFILSDDLAQGDLGCYGQKLIQTPNLDRMAREGTRYTQAYCGTTVCAPSRTSLMIGQHTGHSPIRANREIKPEGQMPLPAGTFTVAQLLKSAGYATACVGKWGMGMFDTTGSPLKLGFDHFFGYNCQRHAHSYFPTYLYNDEKRFDLPGNDGNTKVEGKGAIYAQDLIADETLKFIRANRERPFFLYHSITLPHGTFQINDQGIYKDKPWTEQEKNYAAMVTRLDSDVGRILALLKELKLDDKTLVMLAGDNGSSIAPNSPLGKRFDQAANGMRGFKRELYEGGLRQAALARWPGVVPAGRVSDEPWAFWDFLPTIAELSGAKIPDTARIDGLSLASFLKGGPAPKREHFYWELHEGASLQAVRWGDWKAVRNGPSKPIEIYDLKTDAAESKNLAAARPELVAKAEALMKSARVEDPNFPLRDSKPGAKKGAAGFTSETRTYKKAGDRELKVHIEKPTGWKESDKRPAIVFFFGGGWVGGGPGQFQGQSEYLATRGMVGVRVEYRVIPKGDSGPPVVCCNDAKSAMRWVRTHAAELGIDPHRIAAAGGSAGGHLAAFTSMVEGVDDPADDLKISPRGNALVLFNPVFDNGPEGGWGRARVGERYKEFSPAHNITPGAPPVIVFLGAKDALISVAVLERFKAGMTKAGVRCETRVYEGQPHGFFNQDPYKTATLTEADKFLASLGWLTGEPTLTAPVIDPNAPVPAKASKKQP
jgi:arylsulfatase A-like enzyme/dienelactone hydrolase